MIKSGITRVVRRNSVWFKWTTECWCESTLWIPNGLPLVEAEWFWQSHTTLGILNCPAPSSPFKFICGLRVTTLVAEDISHGKNSHTHTPSLPFLVSHSHPGFHLLVISATQIVLPFFHSSLFCLNQLLFTLLRKFLSRKKIKKIIVNTLWSFKGLGADNKKSKHQIECDDSGLWQWKRGFSFSCRLILWFPRLHLEPLFFHTLQRFLSHIHLTQSFRHAVSSFTQPTSCLLHQLIIFSFSSKNTDSPLHLDWLPISNSF